METICKSFEPVVVEIFYQTGTSEMSPLGARKSITHPWLNTAVIEDSALQPRDQEMSSLSCGLCIASQRILTTHQKKTPTWSFTPEKRSNMTARKPPGTSYRLALTVAAAIPRGTVQKTVSKPFLNNIDLVLPTYEPAEVLCERHGRGC